MVSFTEKEKVEVPFNLCNFRCQITHELRGSEGSVYRLKAWLHDGQVREFMLRPREFGAPKVWVPEQLGSEASITVGHSERMTAAVETTSQALGIIKQHAIMQIGYATHGDTPIFVAPNLVLTLPGADTSKLILHLPSEVARYSVAEVPTGVDLTAALEAAARVLDIGPLRVVLPQWLMAFRATLPFIPPPRYAIWLFGVTGSLKSSTAAVCQNFFGRTWHHQQLPASFLDTVTILESAVHFPRHMLTVIDDAKGDGQRSSDNVEGVAGRILRSIGNGTGRGRSRADLTQHPNRDPRSAVIITSEKQPPGGSAAARTLTVHMRIGDIDKARLSVSQRDGREGLLESAMTVFIARMLEQSRDPFVAAFGERQRRQRDQAEIALRGIVNLHGRTADTIGDLAATAEVVLNVFRQHGVALPFDAAAAMAVLTGSGGTHSTTIADVDPVVMFRRTLRELLDAGTVQIAERSTGRPPDPAVTNPDRWGWSSQTFGLRPSAPVVVGYADFTEVERARLFGGPPGRVYLRRAGAYAAVVEALRRQGRLWAWTSIPCGGR
jgi:hypothetical protein